VERVEILVSPNVIEYLDELIQVLYQNNYFGFRESAEKYVSAIYSNIPNLILHQTHKNSPKKLKNYGEFYISFQSNNRTTWYIFFSKNENRYLVKYITNNHVVDAKFLEHI
jgi:hypothetical protein